MTASTVNGRNGCDARAGAWTLDLLAAPLNSKILHALRDEPMQQVELRRATGHPAQTTLRAQLKKLGEAGAIEKRRRNRFPGVLEYELSDEGRALRPVMAALERWLEGSPEGPLELGGAPAKAAVKALTEGWSTTTLRALAAKTLTLTELDRVISTLNYPSLERRLSAMRLAGLVEPCQTDGRGTPYGVTAWARKAIAPILTAVRWEHRHAMAAIAPLGKIDVETVFLLAADLLSAPVDVSGSCRFAVELRDGKGAQLAGMLVSLGNGRVASRSTRLEGDPDSWASGSPADWFAAVIDHDLTRLELGGNGVLARMLVDRLHDALFANPVRG